MQKKAIDGVIEVLRPDSRKILFSVVLFVISVEMTGSWRMIISNISDPTRKGFSAGFPFEIINKVSGFCPSTLPSSEPVDCIKPSINLKPAGLIANLAIIYTVVSTGVEKLDDKKGV